MHAICVSHEAIEFCEEGRTRVETCSSICEAAGGQAIGCVLGDVEDECRCTATTCNPDQAYGCANTTSARVCLDHELVVQPCWERCADEGLDFSLGCLLNTETSDEECLCAAAGSPCDGTEVTQCVGVDTIVQCVDSQWVLEACAEHCGDSDGSCMFDSLQHSAVCQCG